MLTKRVIIALVLFWVVNAVTVQSGSAQIIDASIPSSGNTVTQATRDFDKAELSGGVKQTSWPSIPWPTITMPKFTMPTMTMPKLPPLWPSDANGDSPALLSPFVAGYAKVSAGARKTWEGTKDLFSVFQTGDASQPASRSTQKPKASFWQRLTTRTQESSTPQTVGEFMKQPRLNP